MLLRGSEWRQWDLHVHTPDTILEDRFGDWEEYLSAIEANPDVKVIGVTDYMSITNYSKLKKLKENGRLAKIDLLIPNLEFRVAPPTDQATAVNLHIFVSPDDPAHEQEIIDALGRLTWEYDRRPYSCIPHQLTALGKAFDPKIKDDKAALQAGTLQFKADFTKLRDWYRSEHWLNRNSLIAVSAGSDGLSGFRQDGAWAALRDEISRFSQLIFAGRPKEREFWLGLGSNEDREFLKTLGGPKPCVHGCDAHGMAKLFKPDHDRFCWIKADTTFEGLKQILYEPEDRVYIGPTPPNYHDEARVIRALRITGANGWFDDMTVPVNPGLVSIIGQKGTGKSALAELMAYAAGSWDADEPGTFLRRAGQHLEGLSIGLEWADGSDSSLQLWDTQPDRKDARYLSQKFVERLCADDHIGNELVAEIERVIFSYIDPTDTLNASDFDELRALRTEAIRDTGQQLSANLARLINEDCTLREARRKLPEKRERDTALIKEKDGLAKQMPIPASKEEALTLEKLQQRRTELAKIQQLIATDKQQLQKIKDIRARISTFKSQMDRFASEIDTFLTEAGVPQGEHSVFHPAFPADTEPALSSRKASIDASVRDREGSADKPAEGTLRLIEKEILTLSAHESADKARAAKIKDIQTRISTINTELARLEQEIAKIEGPDKERLKEGAKDRLDNYVMYFQNMKDEQKTLEELYAPMKATLGAQTAAQQEHNLEFSIRWHADVESWLERGSVLFDQRRAIPYGTMQGLSEEAHKVLVPAWTSGVPELIRIAHDKFFAEFRKEGVPASAYLRANVTIEDLMRWFYEVEHIRLSYGLKYNGVELEKLSPGTKGIVLLILYLGIDVADTRPLIVDQPDENLDNESIFSLLTTYFKGAKQRRQVIVITHNPNLVVNGDSDQVIIATAARREDGLPHITYVSGALEETNADGTGIREQVCRILEGGSDAFLKRERRYALAKAH